MFCHYPPPHCSHTKNEKTAFLPFSQSPLFSTAAQLLYSVPVSQVYRTKCLDKSNAPRIRHLISAADGGREEEENFVNGVGWTREEFISLSMKNSLTKKVGVWV